MVVRCGKCGKELTIKDENIDLFSNRVHVKCEDCDVITDCSLTQLILASVLFNI